MSAPTSRTVPAACKPFVEKHIRVGLHPVGNQRIAIAVAAGQLGAAALELASDVRAQQSDGTSGREPLVEEHPTAGLQPVGDQRVAVAVAVQVSWAPWQLSWPVMSASDQPDRACSGEPPVEEHSTDGLQPVGDQRVALAVAAGQLGTTAAELAGDARHPASRTAPASGEPIVEECPPAAFMLIGTQRVADGCRRLVSWAPRQIELAGDIRAQPAGPPRPWAVNPSLKYDRAGLQPVGVQRAAVAVSADEARRLGS